ncbi:hypothetical protein GALL_534190 [mine drainage metagenome]|uniref:Uncharacterized protein n=1 Tax=mine drainage metagenome TaxID=410659 RepID=A0A1J5P1T5_9ZZZZ
MRRHDLGRLGRIGLDELHRVEPGLGHRHEVLAMRGQRGVAGIDDVWNQAGRGLAGEQWMPGFGVLDALDPRIPDPGRRNLAGDQRSRGIAGGHVDEVHVLLAHAVRLQRGGGEVVLDRTDLHAHGLALQLGKGLDGVAHHQGVIARGVVGDQDDLGGNLLLRRRQGVDQGLAVGVDLAGRQRIHRGHVVGKPDQLDVGPVLLEIAFFFGDIPGHPARPVGQAQGDLGEGWNRMHRQGEQTGKGQNSAQQFLQNGHDRLQVGV